MRTQVVVLTAPLFDQDLRLLCGVEALAIQELVAQLVVERLDGAVLPRRGRFDAQGGNAQLGEPLAYHTGDELGTVVQ